MNHRKILAQLVTLRLALAAAPPADAPAAPPLGLLAGAFVPVGTANTAAMSRTSSETSRQTGNLILTIIERCTFGYTYQLNTINKLENICLQCSGSVYFIFVFQIQNLFVIYFFQKKLFNDKFWVKFEFKHKKGSSKGILGSVATVYHVPCSL